MTLRALFYAYVLGGLTFVPLLICAAVAWSIYTSVPVGDPDPAKLERKKLSEEKNNDEEEKEQLLTDDKPKRRKGWLTVRRTFEESESDGSYMNMMRTFLDARSKDPKRSRPKDMWYVVLKGNVLYLYEDESMTECEAAIQVSAHDVVIYPEGLLDGELFTKRNAICLKPHNQSEEGLGSLTKEMGLNEEDVDKKVEELDRSDSRKEKERSRLEEIERKKAEAKAQAFDHSTPWFIFVRSCVEMEDWYLALVHAGNYHTSSTLEPVEPVFRPEDMNYLVSTLDAQPDVIPMRWMNALLGRIFFSFYRTQHLESVIIGRLMKKLSKVKMPTFLQNVSVTEVSVGKNPPSFMKPMLKDLTKEGDASLEVQVSYKGEIRLTVEATAIINLGQRFKTYEVKLVLAVVLRRLDGNLLVKVKRPPSNRIWYAFTQAPEMELDVEPVVSDRQIKWSMICSTIESRLKEIISESVVLPNMDDIAFFESSTYTHRGGIWGDASRKAFQANTSDSTQPESGQTGALHDAKKSKSTDAVMTKESGTSGESSSFTEVDAPKDEITSVPELPSESTSAKRQSWFKSVSGAPSGLTMESSGDSANAEKPSDGRGRQLSVDSTSKRATSVPASKSSPITPVNSSDADNEPSNVDDEISDGPAHSRIRSLSSGASAMNANAEASSSRESLTPKAGGPNNTSTFFSALKQKTDKQVLSNTAKEAMRKWSANWNGFKRERMGGQGGQGNIDEDAADGVPQSSTSSILFFPSKNRNYADIRAAVTNRKGKESQDVSRIDRSSSSTPIDIPRRQHDDNEGEIRRDSASPELRETDQNNTESPHSSPRTPSLMRKEANRASILPPKVTTMETQSLENLPPSPASFTASEPVLQAPPIRTQPSQGATMMIPGIHASHRGEVQSYGYTPPQPATPENKRTPTIQNMYKLFKAPTANSFSQSQIPKEAQVESSPLALDAGSREALASSVTASEPPETLVTALEPSLPDSSTSKSSPAPQSEPKSAPPPLPPRTRTISAQLSPGLESYSATDALKQIAEQDDTKRKSKDLEASPERPKGSPSRPTMTTKAKRSSLGAKRIVNPTPVVLTEEPESIAAPIAEKTGEVNVTKSAVAEESQVDKDEDNTGQTASAASTPTPKIQPPPLPPRKTNNLALS